MQFSGQSPDDRPARRARRFTPAPWAWVATAAALAAFGCLGTWQLHRGELKQRLLQSLAEPSAVRTEITAITPAPASLTLQRAWARGRFDPAHTLLLEQAHEGQPGYLVWTPLRLDEGASVLVERGWIPRAQGGVVDPPAGVQRVPGLWRALPEPGLRLAGSDNCPAAPRFPLPVLYPTAKDLGCLLGGAVLDGVLVMDEGAASGFTHVAPVPGLPPARHFGYALQWYALGLTAAILFVALNWKRA